MFVRFSPATAKKDGGMAISRHGVKMGEAAIFPLNPMLPNVEMRSFGIWQAGDRIVITAPTGGTNFPHIVGRMVARKVKDEDGTEATELAPSLGGTNEIKALLDEMLTIFKANPAKRFEPGEKFELTLVNPAILAAGTVATGGMVTVTKPPVQTPATK